jgi:O-antigen ligase
MTLDSDRKALHNIFFEVGAETGVLGLLFFLTFFIIPFWDTYRSRNIPGKGNCDGVVSLSVLAGMPGYFLSSMFSSGSLIESSYIIPILAFALSRSDQRGVDGLNTEDTIRDVEIE